MTTQSEGKLGTRVKTERWGRSNWAGMKKLYNSWKVGWWDGWVDEQHGRDRRVLERDRYDDGAFKGRRMRCMGDAEGLVEAGLVLGLGKMCQCDSLGWDGWGFVRAWEG